MRDEETEYRMEPAWTPDGQNILYVTEDEGSNDIRDHSRRPAAIRSS